MAYRSRFLIIIVVVTLLAATLLSRPTAAQYPTGPPCVDRDLVVEFLETNYGERLYARGLSTSGFVVEIYVGPAGTWTILATASNGKSCLLTGGAAWETAASQERSASR